MEERAFGIILRTRTLTETSLIANWLTADFGRISTVAKGALRPKSPFRGKLDLFYQCDFSFVRSRSSALHNLREIVLREPHSALRRDLGWLNQAAYCAKLIEQTTESDTPLPGIFAFYKGLLDHLPSQPAQPRTIYAFELKLLRELGQLPDFTSSKLGVPTRKLCEQLLASDWTDLPNLRTTRANAEELRHFLHGFLIYHLGGIPKGRGNTD
jgi:DNA repair protein RecO (recombination protein O)